ncbi:amino acid adenylation domain-containing protein [Amycolatopsis sp. FDAARGOS 1241]|uniref:non-ribosomal peptide synthetase n=1 Tax=Amycolatopsis sp. FDAARGOS 1241 TaxID=2778070 RepID=UPI001950FF21|nr:amino acid adenylation domain-containing protein [Amycolatopsis sp. FDAARGOS 1241]QRP47849.1 amino acid adenylation domain-containing protein [Amycolatopsis sp. FDAARGOS 1241]
MGEPARADDRFWRDVLVAGGATAIPRWEPGSAAGAGKRTHKLPGEVAAGVRRLARELGVPRSAVLLAAHARVLAALSGEPEVVTGYVTPEGRRLPCRLATEPGTWRALVLETARAEAELLSHRDFPVAKLRRDLGVTGPVAEAVFDPVGDGGLPGAAVLRVGFVVRGRRLLVRLRYRTDALAPEAAARIAGYHATALALLVADPDAEHAGQSLLSPEELRFQLDELAGPQRPLPDLRAHELFEQRARLHPEALAAVHGEHAWTYGELNERANRLARALIAHGVRREDVVAVVTERNLDWLTAVLAVFKAGGAYLPLEPHFPPERIATTLRRAGCELVLTEPGSTATLEQALELLPGVQPMHVEQACAENRSGSDLGVEVAADQLAYIYFTSGSTGEPKGAMCEHAGMLNHLLAKIDDLGIAEGTVVAQTAPQCFDISLWQLLAALLVGGRTLIVEQDVILDAERFVDRIQQGRVAVAQVVPSYLEVVLSFAESHPRALPDLRCVSVTGEALKKELAQRWFAAYPDVKLVNAYGLTETSDDTNHEVMDRVPDSERVPLGRPIANVRVAVVDEHLQPVPLGAPGEIVFSGVCVGRGYVNDLKRTRAAFLPDPYRAGERLYRSGDRGRWVVGGKLEFLGRRDSQVKISGFRIEIGEVENALLRVPGVRDGAVVVAERGGGTKHLVAFYSAAEPLPAGAVQARLSESLPEYLVPSACHWRERLPLTANSKIDKKALTALAAELETADQEYDAPATPAERRLAAAWAEVLGLAPGKISRHDHFFDRGGTSLSAVKLAVALDRAVPLADLTRHPVLADQATLLDDRFRPRTGDLLQPLTEHVGPAAAVLVCFPYAGGNAVNFRPLAQALGGSGPAVLAVELPGHDPAADDEPFAPMANVIDQVVAELDRLAPERVLLWGHSSGAAYAFETARRLAARGVDVRRLFLGAQLLGSADERRAAISELGRLSNAELAKALAADSGYPELAGLGARRAERVGAAFRYDCVSAHSYLASALAMPPAARLTTPVTVVAADDDPITAGFGERHDEWSLLAEHVELRVIAGGGHYFPSTNPGETAQIVLRAVEPVPTT